MADPTPQTTQEALPHVGDAIRAGKRVGGSGLRTALSPLLLIVLRAAQTDPRWGEKERNAAGIVADSIDQWVKENGI